jgi:hypothetical protein
MVPADSVSGLAADRIDLAMDSAGVTALSDYDEKASYHVGATGWRGRLGWKRDSSSDEESGT